MHHPPGQGEHLPLHICLLHQIWAQSLGKYTSIVLHFDLSEVTDSHPPVTYSTPCNICLSHFCLPQTFSCSLIPLPLQDCDRPGRACMTISCSLGPQLKEEALSIDIKLLLNTEILKRVGNLTHV